MDPRPPWPPGAAVSVVAAAYPRRELHLVCDNYATHKHPAVKAWLALRVPETSHRPVDLVLPD
jgi:hypothetical protein